MKELSENMQNTQEITEPIHAWTVLMARGGPMAEMSNT